jgi:hypothetical protein
MNIYLNWFYNFDLILKISLNKFIEIQHVVTLKNNLQVDEIYWNVLIFKWMVWKN